MQWRGMVAPLLATIVLALTCASGHGAPFLRASSPLGPDCPELSGWPRLLELYAGHWDVVNLVALASPHEDAVVEAQRAVLCAAPLALNEYGVEPLVECKEGWYDPATRECAGGLYAGVTGSGSPNGPAWKRFDHGRRTRVYSRDTVPSVANVQRVSNQHDSDTLRPADVSVYVQQGGGGGANKWSPCPCQSQHKLHRHSHDEQCGLSSHNTVAFLHHGPLCEALPCGDKV